VRLRRADEERAAPARRDLAVGLALAASWFSVWGLYAAYTWTASPFGTTLQFARFYVPAAVGAAMSGLGAWSFAVIRQSPFRGVHTGPPGVAQQTAHSRQPAARPRTDDAADGP
jgi:hypothetical protein